MTSKENNKNKNVAFGMSAFLALGMFWFEVEKTQSIHIAEGEGLGHLFVLAGLGATGLVLFFLAGNLWSKNLTQARVIFLFSVCLRLFVMTYIETLENEQVLASGERWTMHMGNIALAFVEVAFAFTQTKTDELANALRNAAAAHQKELSEKLAELRSNKEESILTLSEQADALTTKLDATVRQLNAANDKLMQQSIAVEKYKRIQHCINKPQKRGTRYAMVTPYGEIINCNAEGKQLKGLNGTKVKI